MARSLYKNSPIIEAVLDFGFRSDKSFDLLEVQEAIRSECSEDYPSVSREVRNEFRRESGENPQSQAVVSQVGLCFVSADKKHVFKIYENEVIFSRLKPYEKWEKFHDEARRLVDICSRVLEIAETTKMSLRFVNRFDLPGKTVELADYFTIFPQVPGNFKMSGLAMQVVSEQPDLDSTLVISQALIPPRQSDTISILLDLNLFNLHRRPVKDLWSSFNKMHLRNDEVFEGAITDKARELIR